MAKKTTLTAPRDDAPDLPAEFTPADALSRGDLFEGVAFETLHESDGTHATVLESVFRNVSADDITLSFATINDVEFQDLRVASMRMRGAGLSRVRFIGGRIGTLDLTEARLDAVVLENVRIDYLTLGRATVTDLDIRGSRIDAFDMPAAKAQRVRFTDSEVREFDPREAQVRDVDLRGAQLTMVSDVSALRGMTISPAQAENAAEQFAARLGIAVLD